MAPAALVAATSATGPLLTALAGWAFLGEIPDTLGRIGMAVLFVCAVALPLLD
jgi:drug/metabolite transporter (DMT)-like permease